MKYAIDVLIAIGSGLYWIVTKFFPVLVKKFGLAPVKYGIQLTVSSLITLITLAFWAAFIVFITKIYNQFKDFLDVLSNPLTSSSSSGQGQDYLACFMHLMNASGMANGMSSAFSFTIAILLFMFSHVLYKTALQVLKLVSDELAKLISASRLGL